MDRRCKGLDEYTARLDAYKPYGSSKDSGFDGNEDQKTVDTRSCVTNVSTNVSTEAKGDTHGPVLARGSSIKKIHRAEEAQKVVVLKEQNEYAAMDGEQDQWQRLIGGSSLPWTDVEHHSYMRTVEAGFVSKMYQQHYCDVEVCGNESQQTSLVGHHSLAWLEAPEASQRSDVKVKDPAVTVTPQVPQMHSATIEAPQHPSVEATYLHKADGSRDGELLAVQWQHGGHFSADAGLMSGPYPAAATGGPSTADPRSSGAHAASSFPCHLASPPSTSADIPLLKPMASAWPTTSAEFAEAFESRQTKRARPSPLPEAFKKAPQHHQLFELYGLQKRSALRGAQPAAVHMAASIDVEASVSEQDGSCVSGEDRGVELHHHHHYHYHHIYDDRRKAQGKHPLHSSTPFDQLVPNACPRQGLVPLGHDVDTVTPPGTLSSLPPPSRSRPADGTGVASEDRGKRVLHDDVDGEQVLEVLRSMQVLSPLVDEGSIPRHSWNCDAKAEDPVSGLDRGINPSLACVPPVMTARPAAVWTWGLSGIRKRKKVEQQVVTQ